MPNPKKFRVAICGGGIGGISLALGLARHDDIQIDVYEATAQFQEIGAGITIWGRPRVILRQWGLEDKARAIAAGDPDRHEPLWCEMRRSDQPSGGEQMGYLDVPTGLGFQRAHFLDLLANELMNTGRGNVHFGKRCVSFTQHLYETGTQDCIPSEYPFITLQFLDGTFATCDVLIGSDGIKSTIRGQLLYDMKSEDVKPASNRLVGTQSSGTVAYRCLVKTKDLQLIDSKHPAITERKTYCGKSRNIVTYPVGGGQFVNFLGFSLDSERQNESDKGEWVSEVPQEEVKACFWDFEPDVQSLMKCIDKALRWAIYDLEPLPFWSKGHVTLLGDAAHGMTPYLGSGGGQALEDAYVLSGLLGSPLATRKTLASVLIVYERVRINRANRIVRASREAGRILQLLGEYETKSNKELVEAFLALNEWLRKDNSDPNTDLQDGEAVLKVLIQEKRDN